MRMLRSSLVVMILAALVAPTTDAFAWIGNAWPYRRQVTVNDYRPTQLPGDDVAVVTMPTGGVCNPDGSDIRVATADNVIVPSRVLMAGPGDVVRVAFALRQGVAKYYVYSGNPKPEPVKDLDIRRGVLLEMWEGTGRIARTFEHAQEMLKGVTKVLGRDFRDRIFQSYNPFGPDDRLVVSYTGWLSIAPASAGTYVFACGAHNTGFVYIDDNAVLLCQGFGRTGGAGEEAPVALSAGLHKVTFLQFCHGNEPMVVLAWRTPAEAEKKRFNPVPPGAFSAVFQGTPGMLEQVGKNIGIDFLYEHAGETFAKNRYYQRFGFNAMTLGDNPKAVKWRWDFGDGQASDQPEVQHVYLTPGEYTVSLTGTLGATVSNRVNRVSVHRPWDRVTDHRIDPIGEYAKLVMGYDFKALGPQGAAEAIVLLNEANMPDGVMKAGAGFISVDKAPAAKVTEVLPIYVRRLLAAQEYTKAQAAYLRAAEMPNDPGVSAAMLVAAGHITLDRLGDTERATEIFASALKRFEAMTTSSAIRDAKIGLGDVWRAQGEYDKARQAYAAVKERDSASLAQAPFRRGDFARHVEEYIRTSDYESAVDYLDRWEAALPADKLVGYWSLLAARLRFARSQYAEAIAEAQILVKVNPASNYAAELLMIAYESHKALKENDKAIACLRQITKDFRESPLAAEAAKLLQGGAATRPASTTRPK